MGLDEAGINDDRDMLQEMRLALRAHRTPGMDDDVPTCRQVLRMATESGRKTTAFGEEIGRLDPGRYFDAVLIDWNKATYPYQDDDVPMLDAVIQRAKTSAVDAVYIDGDLVYADGRFTRIDRDEILAEIAETLSKPRTPDELARRELGRAVFPHVKAFYDGYTSPDKPRTPYYAASSSNERVYPGHQQISGALSHHAPLARSQPGREGRSPGGGRPPPPRGGGVRHSRNIRALAAMLHERELIPQGCNTWRGEVSRQGPHGTVRHACAGAVRRYQGRASPSRPKPQARDAPAIAEVAITSCRWRWC